MKYRAACGHELVCKPRAGGRAKRFVNIILETDEPLPGEAEPVKRPEWCDPRCLHRRKPYRLSFPPEMTITEWEGKPWIFVRAYRCRFALVEGGRECASTSRLRSVQRR